MVVRDDDAVDVADSVGQFGSAEAAVDDLEIGELRRRIPPTNRRAANKDDAAFWGGVILSAVSNAAMSFSHRSTVPSTRLGGRLGSDGRGAQEGTDDENGWAHSATM